MTVDQRTDNRAQYVMIGGFLGAGKTTAVDRLAQELTVRGQRVGLITNDQSSGLVDTTILRSRGFAVEEIAGGCFCCRFDSLQAAAGKLTADTRPEVFIAEPVGSCTDLLATVSYPLRRIYGDRFRISPLSVLVDPKRAARILGLSAGRAFSPKVAYVYKKQLEEADIIVINKIDTIDAIELEQLTAALTGEFPRAQVLAISARDGEGLEDWFELVLTSESQTRPTMAVNYDLYAEGEALLGWFNATLSLSSSEPIDGNEVLLRLTEGLRQSVDAAGAEIAHLKMTLDAGGPLGQLSVVSVVSSDGEPDLRESVLEQISAGQLILNLRAEMAPEDLSALVAQVIKTELNSTPGLELTIDHEESFRPSRPVPTHRDQESSEQILYCHCAHSRVVPPEVKTEILRRLSDSSMAFEAVPDLCEMSARKDAALGRLAAANSTRIIACYPRAVEWLFHAAGSPLTGADTEVLNMREQSADEIWQRLEGTKS